MSVGSSQILYCIHTVSYTHLDVYKRQGCSCTNSGGKNTVIRAGLSASLCMSRNSNTHFASNLLENLICDFIGYRWVFLCSCFQFFFVFLFRKFCIFFGNRTLSNCKNSKTLACFRTFLDCFGNLLDIIRNLRDQNDICTTCLLYTSSSL